MIKFYLFCKTIHRLAMFALIVLTILMGMTGLYLKYSWLNKLLPFDLTLLRYLHNEMSPYFVLILTVMMATGVVMYIFPLLRKNK